jgi:hypothetical protein
MAVKKMSDMKTKKRIKKHIFMMLLYCMYCIVFFFLFEFEPSPFNSMDFYIDKFITRKKN